MTYPDQKRKPSWIEDDNWTSDKTEWEFQYLLQQWDHRPLTQIEREWIQSLIPNFMQENCHNKFKILQKKELS